MTTAVVISVKDEAYLLHDGPQALLGVHNLIGLAQQRVEGLAGAPSCARVAAHCKCHHVQHALLAAWREGGSLATGRSTSATASNTMQRRSSHAMLAASIHSDLAPNTVLRGGHY